MQFNLKSIITAAQSLTRQNFRLTSRTDNLAAHSDASIPARAISLWLQANKAMLEYTGPSREQAEGDKAKAEADIDVAQRGCQKATRALLDAYPSAFTQGVADPTMKIDMALVQAERDARKQLAAAQERESAARRAVQMAGLHEAAVQNYTRILAQLIGKEAS